MRFFGFLRTRKWVIIRRLALAVLIAFLAYRNWGNPLLARLRSPDPARDLVITKSEFRPDLPGSRPAWIIGIRNNSRRYGYDLIQIQATYFDGSGAILQTDQMTLHQKLVPGQEEVVGSTDYRERPGATSGTLKVIKAEVLK
jgi:hypothetical protein